LKAEVSALEELQVAYAESAESSETFRLKKEWKVALGFEGRSNYYVSSGELKQTITLFRDLEAYCRILPVLGYNSGAFDLKLIRPWFLPYLQEQQQVNSHLIETATLLYQNIYSCKKLAHCFFRQPFVR